MSVGSINNNSVVPQYNQPVNDDNLQNSEASGLQSVVKSDGLQGADSLSGTEKTSNIGKTGIDNINVQEPAKQNSPVAEQSSQLLLINPGQADAPKGKEIKKSVQLDLGLDDIVEPSSSKFANNIIEEYLNDDEDINKITENFISFICASHAEIYGNEISLSSISRDNFKEILSGLSEQQLTALVNKFSDDKVYSAIPAMVQMATFEMNEYRYQTLEDTAFRSPINQLGACYKSFTESLVSVATEKGISCRNIINFQEIPPDGECTKAEVKHLIEFSKDVANSYQDQSINKLLKNLGGVNSLEFAKTLFDDIDGKIGVYHFECTESETLSGAYTQKFKKELAKLSDTELNNLLKNLQKGEFYQAIKNKTF